MATPKKELANHVAPKPEEVIASVLEQYANSIGCAYYFNPKNIVEYTVDKRKSYVALFSLDTGCSGGTAMSRPIMAVLQFGAHGKIFVNPKYSLPDTTSSQFPSHVEGIFLRDGEIWYKALDYDFAKDALCCPSVPVEGKVSLHKGVWTAIKIDSPAWSF